MDASLTCCMCISPLRSQASCLKGNITKVRTQQRCLLSPIMFYIVPEILAKQLGKQQHQTCKNSKIITFIDDIHGKANRINLKTTKVKKFKSSRRISIAFVVLIHGVNIYCTQQWVRLFSFPGAEDLVVNKTGKNSCFCEVVSNLATINNYKKIQKKRFHNILKIWNIRDIFTKKYITIQ